jgi:hypothetical protein
MTRRGKQVRLGSGLGSLVGRLDRASVGMYATVRVLSAWQEISDGLLSAHTTGAHVRDGTLVVFVDGNTWASHFSAMAEQLRAALNERIGEELISSMRFVVSRRVAERDKLVQLERETDDFYNAEECEPLPLTEIEIAQIRASVREIPDEELREAVFRATVKDLEWKKGQRARKEP